MALGRYFRHPGLAGGANCRGALIGVEALAGRKGQLFGALVGSRAVVGRVHDAWGDRLCRSLGGPAGSTALGRLLVPEPLSGGVSCPGALVVAEA